MFKRANASKKVKKVTKKVKVSLNQHASRQPFTSFRGALRWLSARYTGGFWQGFIVGADFILSLHPIFFSDNFDIERQRKNSRNTILKPKTQKPNS
jgi:hypothetical protein